jgi:hypothetical protein
MSTNPEEFEELRKLLRVKRYEQPPPRFFNDFSSRVLDRIEAERASGAKAGSLAVEAPWLVRMLKLLETNSLVAVGFATAVCAMLIGGIVYSESTDQAPGTAAAAAPGDQASLMDASFKIEKPATAPSFSTNAVFSANPFDPSSALTLQPISFTPGQ